MVEDTELRLFFLFQLKKIIIFDYLVFDYKLSNVKGSFCKYTFEGIVRSVLFRSCKRTIFEEE